MKLEYHTQHTNPGDEGTWPTFAHVNDEIEFACRVRKALDHYEHTLATIRDEQGADALTAFVTTLTLRVFDYELGMGMRDAMNRDGIEHVRYSVEFSFGVDNPSAYEEVYWHEADGRLNCYY